MDAAAAFNGSHIRVPATFHPQVKVAREADEEERQLVFTLQKKFPRWLVMQNRPRYDARRTGARPDASIFLPERELGALRLAP